MIINYNITDTWSLKVATFILSMSWMSRLFHPVIVLGRNEYLYMSILNYMWASLSEWWEQVFSNGAETGRQRSGTINNFLTILKGRMRWETFLQSSRLGQVNISFILSFTVVYAMVYSIQNVLHSVGSSQGYIHLYDGTGPR